MSGPEHAALRKPKRKPETGTQTLLDSSEYHVGILKDKRGDLYLWLLSHLIRKAFLRLLKPEKNALMLDDVFCLPYPFSPLLGRRDELRQAIEEEGGFDEWRALDHAMQQHAPRHVWADYYKFERGDSITYDRIWTIFVPGERLVAADNLGNPQIMIFERQETTFTVTARSSAKVHTLSVWNVAWRTHDSSDGFVKVFYKVVVPSFTGSCAINALPIYPLRFLESEQKQIDLEKTLSARGRQWQLLIPTKMTSWVCKGAVISANDDGEQERDWEQRMLDSRVLLTQSHNAQEMLSYRGIGKVTSQTYEPLDGFEPFTDDIASLCPSTVRCILVNTQKVYVIGVESLREVRWDENIFTNQLVLKQNKKELLRGLVGNYLEKDFQKMGDFISHKGRGLIIVLHGPPGTGKTFAAESLAEFFHRPLLALSIGDLIADSRRLEDRLERLFNWCKEWGAILLLDEADVVLEARSIEDVRRNGIVSVFLRKLDYFEGIMFLTTNRIGTIDPAFMSRIQISISMDKLNVSERRAVWENFLKDERLGLSGERRSILKKELDGMAKLDLNGRQIRNTFNIAQSFAHSRNGTKFMTIEDLTEAAEQALGFQEFFKAENEKAKNAARSVWSSNA
ncbi:P-loop containing nucleoside triphosphate hydrolase protein [Rhexocercosporidium sp. MPI-PUGE-AT-0058]|nr:P-loop containing nucleoside triphosphate hydrolase protein [Rhexocercosporidium sp. MPI-PUGE-AT-0058]